MSLYGLDFIQDNEERFFLIEINGVFSGMRGFRQIYGDNRVQERAYSQLQERFGTITVNDGTYWREKFKKEHPVYCLLGDVIRNFPWLHRILFPLSRELRSPKALLDWTIDGVEDKQSFESPFPIYRGQESTIISLTTEDDLPHPLVNPHIAESVTKNKFYQHRILKRSELRELLPPSALVGLGWVHEPELDALLVEGDDFIIKPLQGKQGEGIKRITSKEIEEFRKVAGPIDSDHLSLTSPKPERYLENCIRESIFSCQTGLALIQPFIDSTKLINGETNYTCIRAIVCNGKFIDAYERYGSEPRVNLSRNAQARPFHADGFDDLCERTVAIYEEQCAKYDLTQFNAQIWEEYFEEVGPRVHRKLDLETEILSELVTIMNAMRR
ncbi:TPA: hypothetical protein HA241_04060 [Candidatus Woesearchaeota archaeon]|nr:hypothetical protein [Candidatus Woesearchaeota archaeon]